MQENLKTLHWQGETDGHLVLLDQTRLPNEIVEIDCHQVSEVWHAIKCLAVRGAPAIGCAAAYGVCLSIKEKLQQNFAAVKSGALEACEYLATSRPTAVNLFWALDRMRAKIEMTDTSNPGELAAELLAEARAIHKEDQQMCADMGRHGADLFKEFPVGFNLLTHCNAGALATGGDGTALSVIFELARRGKQPHVWVDETRPLLQGARLTAWELMQRGIDCTLICDSMAAQVMSEGRVQAVITGADRIASNGDAANKIGTKGVAILAQHFDISFYVAAPTSTFDFSLPSGDQIPIEQRSREEITAGFGRETAPKDVQVYNPAFDVTPANLISKIITERGAIDPTLSAVRRLIQEEKL